MQKRYLFPSVIWAFIIFFFTLPALAETIVDTAWVRRYNGLGSSHDNATAIGIDDSGNVYITGMSYGILGTSGDYTTIKYYPKGDTAWVRRYNGSRNDFDIPSAIAVDSFHNVYVTGYSGNVGTGYDYATIKYFPNGDTAWLRKYNGWGGTSDEASDIAVDGSGNVYVTGESGTSGQYPDYATIEYHPNGDTAWVRRYDGPGNDWDEATSIALDDSGNVYVTGLSGGLNSSSDYATIKYYPNGDTAWVRRYNGLLSDNDEALDIVVEGTGNVYVTGGSYGIGTNWDYATIKYHPNGDTAWVRRYNGTGNGDDRAFVITTDDDGNVYISGQSVGIGSGYDFATIKYRPNGDTAWVRRYNGPGNADDVVKAMVVDDSGNVYVTGESYGSGTYNDYATVKYCPDGSIAWVTRYNGPASDDDRAYSIAVDGSGYVYVTGGSSGTGTFDDYATIKYLQFLCGDVNKDGVVDIGDVVYIINYIYKNGPAPVPILRVGDVNSDRTVDVGDIVYLINYLFKSGPAPSC